MLNRGSRAYCLYPNAGQSLLKMFVCMIPIWMFLDNYLIKSFSRLPLLSVSRPVWFKSRVVTQYILYSITLYGCKAAYLLSPGYRRYIDTLLYPSNWLSAIFPSLEVAPCTRIHQVLAESLYYTSNFPIHCICFHWAWIKIFTLHWEKNISWSTL